MPAIRAVSSIEYRKKQNQSNYYGQSQQMPQRNEPIRTRSKYKVTGEMRGKT